MSDNAEIGAVEHTPGWPCGGQVKCPACCQRTGEKARAWDQGWKTAVAWMRLGASGDLPANPYEQSAGRGLHPCEACGIELDADDLCAWCEDCADEPRTSPGGSDE